MVCSDLLQLQIPGRAARTHASPDTSMLSLPPPVTSIRSGKPFRKPSLTSTKEDVLVYRLRLLSSRSRLTNLGALLLVGILFLSLMLNVRHWTWDAGGLGMWPGGYGVYRSIEETMERTKDMRELEHLIIVPGHGGASKLETLWVWRRRDSRMHFVSLDRR